MSFIPNPPNAASKGQGYVTRTLAGDFRFAPHTRNFIRDIQTSDCARPWWLYVATFIPAYLELALTVAVPDLEDILRAEAKALASEPTGGRRRRGAHTARGRATARASTIERYSQAGLRTLLVVTQPLEYIGLGALLYFGADRFFYRWGSLIRAFAPCVNDPGNLHIAWQQNQWSQLASLGPTPGGVIVQNTGGWPASSFSAGVPEGVYQAFFAATLSQVQLNASGFQSGVEFVVQGSIFGGDERSGLVFVSPQGTVTALVQTRFTVAPGGFANVIWGTYGSIVPVGVLCNSARLVIQRRTAAI